MGRRRFSAEATLEATSNPDIGELSTTVRRGAAISAVTLGLVQVVSLVQTLILARLLSPEEIGLFAAGTVLSGFLIGFSEGGLRGALIQREDRVTDAADTVFWATVGTGGLLAVASLGRLLPKALRSRFTTSIVSLSSPSEIVLHGGAALCYRKACATQQTRGRLVAGSWPFRRRRVARTSEG